MNRGVVNVMPLFNRSPAGARVVLFGLALVVVLSGRSDIDHSPEAQMRVFQVKTLNELAHHGFSPVSLGRMDTRGSKNEVRQRLIDKGSEVLRKDKVSAYWTGEWTPLRRGDKITGVWTVAGICVIAVFFKDGDDTVYLVAMSA